MASGGSGGLKRSPSVNTHFVVLVVAHSLTRLAFWMAFLGVMSLASFTLEASPAGTAIIFAVLGLPFIVLAPFSGMLVDRSDAKWTLAATYVVGGVLAFALRDVTELWQLVAGAAFWGVSGTLILPSLGALLKRGLVPEAKLPRANSIIRAVWEVTLIAGPVLAGVLTKHVSTRAPFEVSAALYAVGLVVLAFLPRSPAPRAAREAAASLAELRLGVVLLFRRPELRALAVWGGFATAGLGAMIASEPVFVREFLGGGAERLGVLYSLSGVGATIGAIVAGSGWIAQRELPGAAAGAALSGVCLALYGGIARWPDVVVPVILLGTGLGMTMTLAQILLQRRSSPELVGRVLAAHRGTEAGFDITGSLTGGAIAAAVGVRSTLIAAGAVITLAGVMLGARARSLVRPESEPSVATSELQPPPLALERFD